ncbi:LOW QUALITY PROTEIN: hypothetical protein HID58_046455 [Brassica napus]|uniref:Uncharacterized protein n=1 Tax=Brassica napus TaxID=3708 RepID=A0ABQ8AX89_BRANA|nr:LOW QUALITY PROTEIN: hypothetical protein HID58_046455 [Brassica napus]
MSLFLSRFSRKHELVRRSFHLLSNAFSTSLCQTHPCSIIGAKPCLPHKFSLDNRLGTLNIINANPKKLRVIHFQKKLVYNDCFDTIVTIGASHGWVASLKEDGIMRLHDDLNPYALSHFIAKPKSSPTCQCHHLLQRMMKTVSFCKPAGKSKPEWTNIKIESSCFYSSRVMFSKKDDMFRIPGSGGHLIGSWDPCKPSDDPKL